MRAWLLTSLLMAGPLLAQEVRPPAPVDPISSAYLVKLTLGLVFIILLIFGLAWLARKMQLTPLSSQQLIRIVSAVSVGNRDRIALVEVGGEQILLGLSPGRIEKLHVLASPVSIDEAEQGHAQSPFAQKLAGLMNTQTARRNAVAAARSKDNIDGR
jgi:flagellar protein FliO/FliZ